MKALHALAAFLLMAIVTAGGAGLAWVALRGGASWSNALAILEEQRPVVGAVGIAGVALGGVWAVSLVATLRRGRGRRYLAFENPGGDVEVSLDAVRDFLSGMGTEFDGLVRFHPEVRAVGGELAVTAVCEVRAGCAIPEWSQQVQERIRERIVTGIGIASVRPVRVVVRQIVEASPGRRAGRSAPPPAPPPEPPVEAPSEEAAAEDDGAERPA